MAAAKLPPFIASISDKLGEVVYRTSRTGKIYASKAPGNRKKKTTQAQRRQQERFTLANEYANQAKDKPVYTELARKTGRFASRIAFSDWWHGPLIHEISRRSRCIRIDTSDNVHVAKVRVTICDEEGKSLEQERQHAPTMPDWNSRRGLMERSWSRSGIWPVTSPGRKRGQRECGRSMTGSSVNRRSNAVWLHLWSWPLFVDGRKKKFI